MATDTAINVLLIEDSPSDARLVEELFHQSSHQSFNVVTASTLSQGLELLSANSVDAVLLDLGLPDSQGLETFHAVYARAPHLPIIVLTISNDEALGERALEEGAQRFISKDALTLGASYAPIFARMIRFAIVQKREEAARTASEEQFRTLFEYSPIVQIRYDRNGYPIMVNRAAREFLGIDDVSAIQHLSIFTSPRVSDADKTRLKARKPARYEQIYDFNSIRQRGGFPTTRSGVRYVDFSLVPIFDKDGALEAYLAQAVDITERKHAEDALREAHEKVRALNEELQVANEELENRVQERTEELASMNEELRASNEELRQETAERTRAEEALKETEARYRSLVERNFDGVIIHSDGIIRFANDAAARIMKAQSPDELIGMSALDLPTPEYRELLAQRVQEITAPIQVPNSLRFKSTRATAQLSI